VKGKGWRWRTILAAAALLLSAGCGENIHRRQSYVFGTLVEITVHGEDEAKARRVTDQVLRDFDRMHQTLHAWQPGALERVNDVLARARPGAPARADLPAELVPILRDAARLSEQSGGLFDPAIGNLVRLWGFHSDTFEPRLPDPKAIEGLVEARPRMNDLRIEDNALTGTNPAVRIDLGGYAKGYALDLVAAYLKSQGVKNALINIGGNIMALGDKNGTPWRVGIQHPRRAGALATLDLKDGEAIGTSGDYQRFFEVGGKRYCHLIDPRTGWPVDHTRAVTVIARGEHAGTLSDVASKPLFIVGPGAWRAMAGRMGINLVLVVAADGGIAVTRAMNDRLSWEKNLPAAEVSE
jgi:thiamine biosynthesis lipoprotein